MLLLDKHAVSTNWSSWWHGGLGSKEMVACLRDLSPILIPSIEHLISRKGLGSPITSKPEGGRWESWARAALRRSGAAPPRRRRLEPLTPPSVNVVHHLGPVVSPATRARVLDTYQVGGDVELWGTSRWQTLINSGPRIRSVEDPNPPTRRRGKRRLKISGDNFGIFPNRSPPTLRSRVRREGVENLVWIRKDLWRTKVFDPLWLLPCWREWFVGCFTFQAAVRGAVLGWGEEEELCSSCQGGDGWTGKGERTEAAHSRGGLGGMGWGRLELPISNSAAATAILQPAAAAAVRVLQQSTSAASASATPS